MKDKIFSESQFQRLIEYLFKVMDYQDSIGDTDTRDWMQEMIMIIAKHTEFKEEKK